MHRDGFSTIVVGAGEGARLGAGVRKALVPLGGRPLLAHCLDAVARAEGLREIVLVVHPRDVARIGERYGESAPAGPAGRPIRVVAGGARRWESVRRGLACVEEASPVVAVHDAARPFLTARLLEEVVRAAGRAGAAACAVPVRDTVKRVTGGGMVRETLPRGELVLVQTPQAFRRDLLERALGAWDPALGGPTDEAQAVEALGEPVRIVPGLEENRKITTPRDLELARAWLQGHGPGGGEGAMRTGFGWDIHRLEKGGGLRLGGIDLPFDRRLAGHSDGDVLLHAVCDALLGAAGLGDIGEMFPDTDPRLRGADSRDLTRKVVARLREHSLAVEGIDLTVVAERPRLAPHKEALRGSVAGLLGVAPARVNLKAKTAEGLGAVGEGRALEAYALAVLGPDLSETRPSSGRDRSRGRDPS